MIFAYYNREDREKAGGEWCPNCQGTGSEQQWMGCNFFPAHCFRCDGTGIYLLPDQERKMKKNKNR